MKILKHLILIIILIYIFNPSLNVSAHPGGKDENGCHFCRTNCDSWGYEYDVKHCHLDTLPQYNTPINDRKNEENIESKNDSMYGITGKDNEIDWLTKYGSYVESTLIVISYFVVAILFYFFGSMRNKK